MIDAKPPQAEDAAGTLNGAYLELARDWELWNQPLESALQRVTETVAAAVDTRRVGVWWHDEHQAALVPLDLFDRAGGRHHKDLQLPFERCPSYLAALESGRIVDAGDAHADPRTRELSVDYLTPNRVGAVLDATLRSVGRTCGVLCIEHVGGPRPWTEAERRFAVSVADLVSQLLDYDRTRASEERYRGYFDQALIGLAMTSPEKGWLGMNSALCDMLGYTREQLRRMTWVELTHPDDVSADVAQFDRLLSGEIDGCHLEKRYIRADGCVIDAELSLSCQRRPDGSVDYFVALIKDVSHRKAAESALRRNEALLAEAQAVAHLGNWDLNLATGRATWSDEEFRLLGYRPGEIEPSGDAFMAVVHPADRGKVAAAMRRARAKERGGNYAIEHRVLLGSGQVRMLQQKGRVTFDAEGRPLRMFGTTLDVTERVQTERALRDSEQRYRALFDNAGDAVFLMAGGRMVDCNPAMLEMFRCIRSQLLGSSPYAFSPPRQPDGRASEAAAGAYLDRALAGIVDTFEWTHRPHDGSEFDAEVTLTKFDLDGVPHLLGIVRDVTERRAVARALQQSSADLAASNWRLRWINEVSVRLHGTLDEQTIVQEAVTQVRRYIDTAMGSFVVRECQGGNFRVVAFGGEAEAERFFTGRAFPRTRLIDRVREAGGVLACPAVDVDFAELPAMRDKLVELGMRSAVIVLLSYRGEELGLVMLHLPELPAFGPSEQETLEAFGKTVSLALANSRQVDHLEHQAQHDSLTGLPNRARLHAEFERWLQAHPGAPGDGPQAALLLLDLDRFKEVNDTLGHHMGDRLLCKIGPRLQGVLERHAALLYRLGGDEFAVLMKDVHEVAAVEVAAARLLRELRAPFQVDGMTLSIGGSVGVALYPVHGADSHALLRSADVAMYNAKHTGLGSRVYDPELDQHTPKRLAMISDLDRAVREHQLVLHYQPKLELKTGRILGFEALVRWQHPELGLLHPAAFMDLAEMSDVIHGMTLAVFELALAQQQRWRAAGRHYAVSINLSARNLLDDRCVRRLQELIPQYDTDPASLELEITETALMADPEGAVTLLNQIADLGVLLSIDDYGTGYSSLAYLRRLPIFALKIDRTFVKDMLHDNQDAVIVRSTIGLAHNLDLLVVAEGVEDAATLAMLEGMDCDIAQGYYLSKPLAAEAVLNWLDSFDAVPERRHG